jgi:tetratricopeptide (TPR) repeat protein
MLQPKKQIYRKELKEDTLITSYVKATSFYEEHKRQISMGIVAVLVIAVVGYFYTKSRSDANETATVQLAKVYSLYDNGQYQIAIDGVRERNIIGLKAIVSEYGGSYSGNLAKLYLANSYYSLGKFADALSMYEDFSADGQLFTVTRYAGIGSCSEALGKSKDAGDAFEKAASKYSADVNAAENYSNAARNYAAAGEKEKALEIYKKIKKSYPTSQAAREADRYIARLAAL